MVQSQYAGIPEDTRLFFKGAYLLAVPLSILCTAFRAFSYFPVSEVLVSFVTSAQMVLGWTLLLEGGWIIAASVYQFFISRVLCIQPVLATLLRIALYSLISILLDILNTVILHGFS